MMQKNTLAQALALALAGYVLPGFAQSTLDMQAPKPPQPLSSDAAALPSTPAPQAAGPAAGGASVVLQSVEIQGNRAIATDVLLAHLGAVQGLRLDMGGLTALAQRLSDYYRASGYPFAQVYLPPQEIKNGVLRLQVEEGRYGQVKAQGAADLAAGAQPFLDYGIKPGDPIENRQLERTLLIMDDQAGMKIRPIIRPGAQRGEADLLVNVERSSHVSGEVGFDNTGAPSTGVYRLHGAAQFNSPFRYGDKVSVNGMYTDEHMWLGSVDYDTPLGASGLRGQVGYAHTSYQLGGSFAALQARGIANVTTAKLSYPLVRSQATNVLLSVGVRHQSLQDDYRASGVSYAKSSDGIPVGLQFDHRDNLLGGGVSYGSLSLLVGKLNLGAAAAASDAATAMTQGGFSKINLDVARIQRLGSEFSAYGRFSGQWANKNLDASEKFNLGGFYGVRAYPLGEGVGDRGWFTQLELRYTWGQFTPFAFYDFGQSKANIAPWDANSSARRTLAGAGWGVRTLYGQWSVDATLAWQAHGGTSTADPANHNPRLFVMLGRRF